MALISVVSACVEHRRHRRRRHRRCRRRRRRDRVGVAREGKQRVGEEERETEFVKLGFQGWFASTLSAGAAAAAAGGGGITRIDSPFASLGCALLSGRQTSRSARISQRREGSRVHGRRRTTATTTILRHRRVCDIFFRLTILVNPGVA